MYNKERVIKVLKIEESYSDVAYPCTRQHWTIGYGHKIKGGRARSADDLMADKTCLFGKLRRPGDTFKDVAERVFLHDIDSHFDVIKARLKLPRILNDSPPLALDRDCLSQYQQDIIDVFTCMAFQIGASFCFWPKTWKAYYQVNYHLVAKELLDSDWHRKDSPRRAQRMANWICYGWDSVKEYYGE